ncbi:MAG: helix-turn-helix domain-containing protein [Alphaproteobacteria bacterium]|nr:helix-turn-helix domain-containing protein [Alphaproteobacteria bacterium]
MTGTAEIKAGERVVQHPAPEEDVNVHIGGRLRKAREWADLSQQEFAAQLAIPLARLSQYETGARQLTLDDLMEACALLRINPLYLFADDGDDATSVRVPADPNGERHANGTEAEALVRAFEQIPDRGTRAGAMTLIRSMAPRHSA